MTATEFTVLQQEVSADEGVRRDLYDDATGKPIRRGDTVVGTPTIGVGINLLNGLTTDEVMTLFRRRLATVLTRVSATYPWFAALSPARQRVIVNVAYNVGVDGLGRFPRMLAALEAGDYATAAAEVLDSHLAPARAKRLHDALLAG